MRTPVFEEGETDKWIALHIAMQRAADGFKPHRWWDRRLDTQIELDTAKAAVQVGKATTQ